jgi:hypothetical protein
MIHLAVSRADDKGCGISMRQWAPMSMYRLCCEGSLISGGYWVRRPQHGIGHVGVDFWDVLKAPGGVETSKSKRLCERYVGWGAIRLWITHILGPGKDGPAPTRSFQMLRESLQEAEARVYVENALLDHADKLGPDLAGRVKAACDERSAMFRYFTYYFGFEAGDYGRSLSQSMIEDNSRKLYQLADEVNRALAK